MSYTHESSMSLSEYNRIMKNRMRFWPRLSLAVLLSLIGIVAFADLGVPVLPTVLMFFIMFCLVVMTAAAILEWWELPAAIAFFGCAIIFVAFGGLSVQILVVAAWSLILSLSCLGCRDFTRHRLDKCGYQ